jgi:hypothetical protein
MGVIDRLHALDRHRNGSLLREALTYGERKRLRSSYQVLKAGLIAEWRVLSREVAALCESRDSDGKLVENEREDDDTGQ